MPTTIQLTTEQCSLTKFPIGCPVWYNFDAPSSAPSSSSSTALQRGVIKGALFPGHDNQLVYEVAYIDKNGSSIVEEVADGTLGFGASCPVSILPANDDAATAGADAAAVDAADASDHRLEGEIVLCTPSSNNSTNEFVYTAVIYLDGPSKVNYEDKIEESRVVYRKVDNDERVADKKSSSSYDCSAVGGMKHDDCVDAASKSHQNTAKTTTQHNDMVTSAQHSKSGSSCEEGEIIEAMPTEASSASARARNQYVPSSITYNNAGVNDARGGTNISLSATESFVSSNNASANASSVLSQQSRTSKKPRYISELDLDIGISPNANTNTMEITIPLWLQKDCQAQRNLFFHLIGRHGSNTKNIESNSRCKVRIKVILGDKGPITVPMTIHVEAMNAPTALEDLTVARQMIQSLLLQFVGNDGSRGRLLVEVAQSCWGEHRPDESTSQAVKDVYPFTFHFHYPSEDFIFMSIVELPAGFTTEGPIHAAALLSRDTLGQLKAVNAFIRVVADEFKITTKLCDPYVLVSGNTYQSVDRGVEIVKEVIRSRSRKHQDNDYDAQWAL
jgi:hypothetical protein